MQIRTDASPIFYEDDLTDEAMDIYKEILEMYDENISDSNIVGLGISLARIINNEQFGIGVTEMANKNLLRKDISDFMKEKASDCELHGSFKDEESNINDEDTYKKKYYKLF